MILKVLIWVLVYMIIEKVKIINKVVIFKVVNIMGKHKNPIVQAKKSAIHGLGCFAVQFIPEGQRIVEYSGPRLNLEQTLKALEKGNEYIFDLDSHYSVDGSVMSNAGRYLNHSCDPNCEVQFNKNNQSSC